MRYGKSVMVIFILLFVVLIPCLLWAADGVAENDPVAEVVDLLLAWLPATWEGWATLVIAVCAIIAATWPRPKEDAHIIWRWLYAIINALGANFGRATNADDKAAKLAKLARLGKGMGK